MKIIYTLLLTSLLVVNSTYAQKGKDAALETFGSSSGLLLYNTYLALGTVSDAYAGECYKADLVKQLSQEQINSLELMVTQYNKLLESGFLTEASDKSFVTDMVVILGYLKNQAKYLNAYSESGSAEDTEKYEYNRNEAWTRISKLLGFEEKQ